MAGKVVRLSLISSLIMISHIALSFIPNVEVVTLFIVVFTVYLGKQMYLAVATYIMLNGIIYGFGYWWVGYWIVWPLLVTVVLSLRKVLKDEVWGWALVVGLFGVVFGAVFAITYIPIDPYFALTYWIAGIPWDVMHGLMNIVVMLVVGRPVFRIIGKLVKDQVRFY